MPALSPALPFGTHDYQIVCQPNDAPREVNIRAFVALPLRVGDRYTVGRKDCLYDLVVEEISRLAGGRWNARCRVADRLWL